MDHAALPANLGNCAPLHQAGDRSWPAVRFDLDGENGRRLALAAGRSALIPLNLVFNRALREINEGHLEN